MGQVPLFSSRRNELRLPKHPESEPGKTRYAFKEWLFSHTVHVRFLGATQQVTQHFGYVSRWEGENCRTIPTEAGNDIARNSYCQASVSLGRIHPANGTDSIPPSHRKPGSRGLRILKLDRLNFLSAFPRTATAVWTREPVASHTYMRVSR